MASRWETQCRHTLYYAIVLFLNIASIAADVFVKYDGNVTDAFRSMQSDFGGVIPEYGLTGLLFVSEPLDACHLVERAPSVLNGSGVPEFNILLIKRGNCQFDFKVLQAQDAGYDAAIVYNDNGNGIRSMPGSDYAPYVRIPSVFVGFDNGMILRGYDYSSGRYITLTRGTTLPWGYYLYPFITVLTTCFIFSCFYGTFSRPFLSDRPRAWITITGGMSIPTAYIIYFYSFLTVIILCLVLPVIYGVTKFIRDRRHLRRIRLSRDHLKKLPIIKFKKGDDRYDCCAICLDDYEEGNKLRVLPCQHAFHCKCIDPWLTNSRRTCPICKRKVVPPGVPDSDDESDDSSTDENTPLLAASRSPNRSSPTPEEMLWGAIGGRREPSPEVMLNPPNNPGIGESFDSGIANNSVTERENDGTLELAPSRDQAREEASLDVSIDLEGSSRAAPIV